MIDCADYERCKNEISLLFSSVTLDKESTVFQDSIEVNFLAIPIFRALIIELSFDYIDG
jgi:hypothetical protein